MLLYILCPTYHHCCANRLFVTLVQAAMGRGVYNARLTHQSVQPRRLAPPRQSKVRVRQVVDYV
eukprot:44848-Eustigmatos_ZCMA.PRE.1